MSSFSNNQVKTGFSVPEDEPANADQLPTLSSLGEELIELDSRKQYLTLRDKAYEYLARREHSRSELLRKLARFDKLDQSEALLTELVEMGHQSDQRFAEQISRARVSAGKGPMMLLQELSRNKIDAIIIEELMATLIDQWHGLAETVRVKKFGTKLPSDYKEWARQSRFLQQRGFTTEQIRSFTR